MAIRISLWLSFLNILHSAWGRPLTTSALQYAPSNIYTYKYTTEVAFNEPHFQKDTQAQKGVGFLLTCDVILTPVWNRNDQMLIRLTIKKPTLFSISRPELKQDVKSLVRTPLYFTWEGSHVSHVYTAATDPVWSANIKIGITSLLQLQKEPGDVQEEDISGRCSVNYKVDGNKIVKTKSDCSPVVELGEFNNTNQVLGVTTKSTTETRFELGDDVIQSASSMEFYITYANAKPSLATAVFSKQHLDLAKVVTGAVKTQASSLQEAVNVLSTREKLALVKRPPLYMVDETACPSDGCKQCSQVVAAARAEMEKGSDNSDSVPVQSPTMFLQLLDALRSSNKVTVLNTLRDPNNAMILPLLIDAAVAAQTSACQMALMELLDFTDTYDISLQERYLLAVAFSTHPSEEILTDLLDLMKKVIPDERLQESIAQSLAAVTYTYCQKESQCKQQIVEDIQFTLLEKLVACSDVTCKSVYIRALGNAALPATLDVLLKHLKTDKDAVAEVAIKALRRFDRALLNTEKTREVLLDVFTQKYRGYESVVRTQALKVLLSLGVTQQDVTEFLRETTDPSNTEFDLYVQERLYTSAKTNHHISNYIKQGLKDLDMNNYDALAPKGKSLAFKSNIAEMDGLEMTYDMYVENSASGVMKRSGMDVDIVMGNTSLSLYSFGIFAAGVEGLVGGVAEEGQEDVDATAGLALNMLDVSLRPVTFFTGKTGLMSAVWNAPSELISALQTSFLLQDHNDIIYLQNGLQVKNEVQGAITIDLSGLLSISLWNKNCHALIKNSAALAVRGRVSMDTAVFRAAVEYTSQALPVIDFLSDVDFYDKIKMCLQMGRPQFTYRHNITKLEYANGFKKSYVARIGRKETINGASYPLPKLNYEQCRLLLNKS